LGRHALVASAGPCVAGTLCFRSAASRMCDCSDGGVILTHFVTLDLDSDAILETPCPSVSFYFSAQPCSFFLQTPRPHYIHYFLSLPFLYPRTVTQPKPHFIHYIGPTSPLTSHPAIHAGTTSRLVSASIRASCRVTISRTRDGVWLNTITTGPADARRSATRARGGRCGDGGTREGWE
jgi:hypothetical protein